MTLQEAVKEAEHACNIFDCSNADLIEFLAKRFEPHQQPAVRKIIEYHREVSNELNVPYVLNALADIRYHQAGPDPEVIKRRRSERERKKQFDQEDQDFAQLTTGMSESQMDEIMQQVLSKMDEEVRPLYADLEPSKCRTLKQEFLKLLACATVSR